MRLNLVETAQAASLLTIDPPAATPEKFSAEIGDFPYLPPLPGSTLKSGVHDPGAMEVRRPTPDECSSSAPVSSSSTTPICRHSDARLRQRVSRCLSKAGWTIVSQNHGSDATLTAHYAAHGREHLGLSAHGQRGIFDQGRRCRRRTTSPRNSPRICHVALYGVLFDFNKASLKSESDGVLQRVLAFLPAGPESSKLEVQGHTDNVGGDDYNQKLSEARANAVMTWLVATRVARLASPSRATARRGR